MADPELVRSGISVVVMAFDEADSLERTVREIEASCCQLGQPYELLIVDDGSRDGTGEVADRLADELEAVRVRHHPRNLGLGGVYRTGFAEARGALVTFFPADGQFPASIIPRFVERIQDCDMVLGYLPAGGRGPLAQLLSRLERALYRMLFGPLPRFQGILLFRRELLERFALRSTGRGWVVLMELIIRTARGGLRVVSEPTELRARTGGSSKVQNWRTIWANLRQLLQLRRVI